MKHHEIQQWAETKRLEVDREERAKADADRSKLMNKQTQQQMYLSYLYLIETVRE
jgi:hypothetical protein